jgi:hypothetical protein
LIFWSFNLSYLFLGVRIARLGYPNRIPYDDFVKRYFIIVDEKTKNQSDKKEATKTIMQKLLANQKIPEKTTSYDLLINHIASSHQIFKKYNF